MTTRNNEDRIGPQTIDSEPTAALNPLEFVAPTELVDIPSKGLLYPADHPLHGKEEIEIRYMTAKEEDILTSKTLLKKGVAIDRFLQNIIVDKNIKVNDLLIGDKNAILIAARSTGYGSDYETQVVCPNCGTKSHESFDLANPFINESKVDEKLGIRKTENNNFLLTMPFSKFEVEIRVLTGNDEKQITKLADSRKKGMMQETGMTDQYKMMIVSVQGNAQRNVINHYVDNMPLRDARFLRNAYKVVNPDVKVQKHFECSNCGFDQEMEVPFGADFLWPDR